MPGSFTYTVSTGTVVVTGGTSGSPADFASFVTADRAGTGTSLRVAGAPGSSVTLTYQIRPVELRALIIKFIIASKTAETDYLFITGTDAWDAALTESIDVTAGNGTYTSTKRFRTITNIDCSDNAAGGGTVWADGTLAVTQDIWGEIWDLGRTQYQIDATFNIGDGSTSTYFETSLEQLYFDTPFYVKAAATFSIGKLVDSEPCKGSCLHTAGAASFWSIGAGTINIYASYWYDKIGRDISLATTCTVDTVIGSQNVGGFTFSGTVSIDYLFLNYGGRLTMQCVPTLFSNVISDHCTAAQACAAYGTDDVIATGITVTNESGQKYLVHASHANGKGFLLRNPLTAPTQSEVVINANGRYCKEQYSIDINVCDKDGVAISGAVVDCEDTTATAVWTAGTVTTNASGDITQQWVTTHYWVDTTETETSYHPHKFTISKAGYETLILNSITVSAAIKWHLELQDTQGGAEVMFIGIGVN